MSMTALSPALQWLYSTQSFGIKLGLENMERLIAELDLAPRLISPKILHVAGTNGKGSVCAFSEKILRDAEIKTGLFTSPHLLTFHERIKVNGADIAPERTERHLERIKTLVADWDPHPTFFEITLAAALLEFTEQACEVIILETGMGGRYDATNALLASVSVITSIGLDHQQWLGESIAEIAAEKAGILKSNVPAIIGDLHPDAREVVGRRALELGISFIEAHPLPEDWQIGLAGPHQRENAALAVEAACRLEDKRLTLDGIRRSLSNTRWLGRFQKATLPSGRLIVLDGAHNADAAQALATSWTCEYGATKAHLIFGVASSKDRQPILDHLIPLASQVTIVPIASERAVDPAEIAMEIASAYPAQVTVQTSESVARCLTELDTKNGSPLLVGGSLFLIGETLGYLSGESFQASVQ